AAVYLLWAGAFRPGGAFQAGAVLAAAAVLLHLAGLAAGWAAPGMRLRAGLAAGFLVFLAVAAGLLVEGALLQYPPAWAGALILLVEATLTVSLGLILAGLFLFLS
ncbi:MAG: MnhB domain-containing protein, partial [Rhodocyclaceae bacterium]|nr:MnhB domain-containing protein [Rhodocyclaceae bacterium]